MTGRSRLVVVGAHLLACTAFPGVAGAFDTTTHQLLTVDGCAAAGLPEDFCRRAGIAAFDVDAEEWDDVTAHAQASAPDDLCGGANAVVARLSGLGQQFFDNLALAQQALADPTGTDAENAAVGMATALGRALHTIQDNCAHRGMTNPEHAWLDRSDMCDGTDLSPDNDADSKQLAQDRTAALLAEIAPTITGAGVADMLGQMSCLGGDLASPCDSGTIPSPAELCSFLGEAESWDGVDRRWDAAIVGDQLDSAFVYGTAEDLCTVDALAAPPAADTDVSAGPPTCTEYHVTCLGDGSAPNGWACLGCAGARPRDGGLGAALLALAGLIVGRRRCR